MHHTNKLRKKTHLILPVDARKALGKNATPFLIKALSQLGMEKELPQLGRRHS